MEEDNTFEETWLPNELRKARLILGETQGIFASRFGVETATAISLWESGKRDMPTHVVSWLCDRLIRQGKIEVLEQLKGSFLEAEFSPNGGEIGRINQLISTLKEEEK